MAEKLHAKMGYRPANDEEDKDAETGQSQEPMKRYEEELEINDFPQNARWKVTSRVSQHCCCCCVAIVVVVPVITVVFVLLLYYYIVIQIIRVIGLISEPGLVLVLFTLTSLPLRILFIVSCDHHLVVFSH